MRDNTLAETIIAHIDGGSRGNPGPAASAFVLTDQHGKQLQARAFFLGRQTNNFAEYTAIHKALEAAKSLGARRITVYSDSELLVRQINGQYKVKSEQIKPLFDKAMEMLAEFENWQVRHVFREDNKKADGLVNHALDDKKDIEMKSEKSKKIKPVRLGVLISGGGTTLVNIVDCIKKGTLDAEVALVISSRSTVAGVERAKAAGLDVKIIRIKDHPDINEFSKCIEKELAAAKVDLVVQGGWLCLWKIPKQFDNRVMNIHPALLPSFGGQGMWGHHVHEAVLKAGCKVSGCTVHFCTNEYDNGPIIVQKCCPVKDDDTPDTLAARVFEQECAAYPEAIQLFAEGKLVVDNGRVRVLPHGKKQAVKL
jgi:formyltetrahydrofolate-dependent phosphoribosylglycinamide formyltransferase